MSKYEVFENCRKCYKHMGGSLATDYFSFLVQNNYIQFIEGKNYNIFTRKRIPLELTSKGSHYFKFMIPYINCNASLYTCLDGTEKKFHLAGEIGDALLRYLLDKKLISQKSDSRILTYNNYTTKFLFKNFY